MEIYGWAGAADPGRQGRQLPTQYFRIYLVNLAQKFCLKFFIKCLPTQYKNGSAAPVDDHFQALSLENLVINPKQISCKKKRKSPNEFALKTGIE